MAKNFTRALAMVLTAAGLIASLAPPVAAAPPSPYSNYDAQAQISASPVVDSLATLAEANDSFRTIYGEFQNSTESIFARFKPSSTGVWGPPVPVDVVPAYSITCTNIFALPEGRIWFLMAMGPSGNNS